MPEWWSYGLSDLQAFTLETYYRLFERYNAAIWPAQIVAVALGLSIPLLLRRPGKGAGRSVAAILAACWVWDALAFHASRYAEIHRAAVPFGWAFGLEALLLVGSGFLGGGLDFGGRADPIDRAGLAIFFFGLLVLPGIGLSLGRSWRQIELFGVAPDPTAAATLGILLLAAGRVRWELLAVPVAWCAVSGATLASMDAPGAWIPALAAAATLLLAAWRTLARRRGKGG